MTPEERRELVRVQREVMWNLQKDYVVTVVGPGDDPVPYKRQGNPAVNTPQSVKRRQALRNKPLIEVTFCCVFEMTGAGGGGGGRGGMSATLSCALLFSPVGEVDVCYV